MTTAATSTVINGKQVAHGDKIVDFRGDTFTFDYAHADRIYTVERPHTAFLHRVFVDKAAA